MRTKKSLKLIYDENRLLYAKKSYLNEQLYDPETTQIFLDHFHAKRREQKKKGHYLFILSCFITTALVYGFVESLNILLQ